MGKSDKTMHTLDNWIDENIEELTENYNKSKQSKFQSHLHVTMNKLNKSKSNRMKFINSSRNHSSKSLADKYRD